MDCPKLALVAARADQRRKSEGIQQDARFLGLISAMFHLVTGKGRFHAETYYASLGDARGQRDGAIRDPEMMRLAMLAHCAATGGTVVEVNKQKEVQPSSGESHEGQGQNQEDVCAAGSGVPQG
jgi:hypothetical protein